MKIQIATKYTHLTKDDHAPMGTVVRVIEDEQESIYVQVNPKDDKPQWVEANLFLGEVFGDMMEHREFVDECIRIYQNKKNNPLYNIAKIIADVNKI